MILFNFILLIISFISNANCGYQEFHRFETPLIDLNARSLQSFGGDKVLLIGAQQFAPNGTLAYSLLDDEVLVFHGADQTLHKTNIQVSDASLFLERDYGTTKQNVALFNITEFQDKEDFLFQFGLDEACDRICPRVWFRSKLIYVEKSNVNGYSGRELTNTIFASTTKPLIIDNTIWFGCYNLINSENGLCTSNGAKNDAVMNITTPYAVSDVAQWQDRILFVLREGGNTYRDRQSLWQTTTSGGAFANVTVSCPTCNSRSSERGIRLGGATVNGFVFTEHVNLMVSDGVTSTLLHTLDDVFVDGHTFQRIDDQRVLFFGEGEYNTELACSQADTFDPACVYRTDGSVDGTRLLWIDAVPSHGDFFTDGRCETIPGQIGCPCVKDENWTPTTNRWECRNADPQGNRAYCKYSRSTALSETDTKCLPRGMEISTPPFIVQDGDSVILKVNGVFNGQTQHVLVRVDGAAQVARVVYADPSVNARPSAAELERGVVVRHTARTLLYTVADRKVVGFEVPTDPNGNLTLVDIDFIPTSQYWAAAGSVLFNHVSSLSTLRNRQLQWSDGVTTTIVPLHGAPDATVAFSQGLTMPTIGVASAFFGRVSSSNFNSVVATNAVAPSVTYTSAALSEKVRASSRIYHGFLRVVPVFGPELPLMVGDYLYCWSNALNRLSVTDITNSSLPSREVSTLSSRTSTFTVVPLGGNNARQAVFMRNNGDVEYTLHVQDTDQPFTSGFVQSTRAVALDRPLIATYAHECLFVRADPRKLYVLLANSTAADCELYLVTLSNDLSTGVVSPVNVTSTTARGSLLTTRSDGSLIMSVVSQATGRSVFAVNDAVATEIYSDHTRGESIYFYEPVYTDWHFIIYYPTLQSTNDRRVKTFIVEPTTNAIIHVVDQIVVSQPILMGTKYYLGTGFLPPGLQSAALYAKPGLYAYDTATNTTTFELDLEYITETVACNNQLYIVAGDAYARTLYKWVSSNVSEVIFTNAYALCGVTCIKNQHLVFHHMVGQQSVYASIDVADSSVSLPPAPTYAPVMFAPSTTQAPSTTTAPLPTPAPTPIATFAPTPVPPTPAPPTTATTTTTTATTTATTSSTPTSSATTIVTSTSSDPTVTTTTSGGTTASSKSTLTPTATTTINTTTTSSSLLTTSNQSGSTSIPSDTSSSIVSTTSSDTLSSDSTTTLAATSTPSRSASGLSQTTLNEPATTQVPETLTIDIVKVSNAAFICLNTLAICIPLLCLI